MQIAQVDAFDDTGFEAWHTTYAAAEAHDRGDHASDWLLPESRATHRADDPNRVLQIFAGVVDGVTVACSEIEVWVNDSPHLARGKVWTRPEDRGRGFGTAMADHLEEQALALGCRTLLSEVAFPYDAPPDGAGHRDVEFARRRGHDLALGDIQRVLRLPVPDRRLALLAAEAGTHHSTYVLRSFTGRVPDDLVEGYVELVSSLDTEAPTGDLDLDVAVPDVTAFRIEEATVVAQQRTRWATVALATDGTVAGYTDLVTSAIEPERAFQWGTLVRHAHRGHRLGLALKVQNLRHLQAHAPQVERVHTWNAEVNGAMVAVNDLLGFAPVERLGEFQKRLLTRSS